MKDNNILGLPPINSDYGLGINQYGMNAERQALPKGEIKEINQDSIRRRVAIDILASNNDKGLNLILNQDQKGFMAYAKSAYFIAQVMEESQGKPHEEYCKAFGERMLQVTAHHTNALLEAGAARIAYEINRPSEVEEEPKGFWNLLKG